MTITTVSQGAGGIVHLGTLDGFEGRTLCGRTRVVRFFKGRRTTKDIVAATGAVECGRCKTLAERVQA